MEIRHIRYFLAVAKYLNFSRAADELGISQPPLSRQIKDMEREVGVALFERSPSAVALTAAGRFLEGEFRRILTEVDAAAVNARAVAAPANAPLRIGCVNSHISTLLPSLLAHAAARMPAQKVEVLMMTTDAQIAALRSGRIDLALVRSWRAEQGIDARPLVDEPFALIHPPAWSSSPRFSRALADLSAQPMAIGSAAAAPALSAFARTGCSASGFEPEVAFESSDMGALLKLVEAGLAWSIVPQLSISGEPRRAFIAVAMTEKTRISFCWKRGALKESAAAFMDTASDFIRERLPGMAPEADAEAAAFAEAVAKDAVAAAKGDAVDPMRAEVIA